MLLAYCCIQTEFEERVVSRRRAEHDRMKFEREERLSQILKARKEERDIKRKMLYYLKTEEERLNRLREEEEARKREGDSFDYTFLKCLQLYVFGPIMFFFVQIVLTCHCQLDVAKLIMNGWFG